MATLTEKEKQEIDNHPRRDEVYQMLSELLGTNTNITQDNIGSAFRFLSDYDEAIDWYQRALKSDPEEEQIHLGIGIVYQLQGDYKNALLHLSKAAQNISLISAWNSLGLTYKKMGRPNDALNTYKLAASNLVQLIIASLKNRKTDTLYPPPPHLTGIWVKDAMHKALLITVEEGLSNVLFPTGESALQQMKDGDTTLWHDDDDTRQYYVNFLNAVAHHLKSDLSYASLMNNIGVIQAEAGDVKNAKESLEESIAFTPDGVTYNPPRLGLESLSGE